MGLAEPAGSIVGHDAAAISTSARGCSMACSNHGAWNQMTGLASQLSPFGHLGFRHVHFVQPQGGRRRFALSVWVLAVRSLVDCVSEGLAVIGRMLRVYVCLCAHGLPRLGWRCRFERWWTARIDDCWRWCVAKNRCLSNKSIDRHIYSHTC